MKIYTYSIIQDLIKKAKKEHQATLQVALGTVDSVDAETKTQERAVATAKKLGYDEIAYYMQLLANDFIIINSNYNYKG